MSHNLTSLMTDAQNHLNGRGRGREARLVRLAAAGVPTDLAGLQRWLNEARDREHEAAAGLFHACTARVSNGVDSDLPSKKHVGCRISRVPLGAKYYDAGTEFSDAEDPLEEPMVTVFWGNCGTGFMEPVHFTLDTLTIYGFEPTGDDDEDRDAACRVAEEVCRQRLLARGDCFRTRAEAVEAVTRMLEERTKVK